VRAKSSPMTRHLPSLPSVSRRTLLLGATGAAVAPGLLRSIASAAPPAPYAGGPLADVYGRIGAPRGRTLGHAVAPGGRTVTWLTTGAQPTPTVVQWGVVAPGTPPGHVRNGRVLTSTATGSAHLVPGGRFDDDTGTATPIDGEHPVRAHRVEIPPLPAGVEVAYRVGDGSTWSPVEVFTTPADGTPLRLAHVGDHGVTVASRRTTAALLERRPDALLLAGDISYANGYQPRWDEWANQAEPLTRVVPLLPAPGNHEAKDYYGQTYRARFSTPGQGRNWYTTDLGRAFLFSGTAGCFLSEKDPASARDLVLDELVGLERSLAAAAARRAAGEIDFLLVAQHFPLYTNHATRGPFSPELVVAQEHILQRYQVDLVLVGHDHMYQRSLPMAYGEATGTAAGYVQVVAGAGGNGLYDFADPNGPAWGDWCASWSRRFSFVEYSIEAGRLSASALGWDDRQAALVDEDSDAVDPDLAPEVIDSFELHRKDGALVAAAAVAPRSAAAIIAGIPEAHGTVVRNTTEDCTRH
jgi:hypothetical protein